MRDACPNCGTDMIFDPCPGYPRGDGTPAPMTRGEYTTCTVCGATCCADVACLKRCEDPTCGQQMCGKCTHMFRLGLFCLAHLREQREAFLLEIDADLEDLICQAIEVFGPDTPPVMALIHAQTAAQQHQFEDVNDSA